MTKEHEQVLEAAKEYVRRSKVIVLSSDSLVCYAWLKSVYRDLFGSTFAPRRLAELAKMGCLVADDSARGGNRRYYTLAPTTNCPTGE